MLKYIAIATLVGVAMLMPAAKANAQHHGHGHGHGHHGHSHHGHHGHAHHGHNHGFGIHMSGHHHGFGYYHYPSWGYAWPNYNSYYPNTYYFGSGINYYSLPTNVTVPRTYVAARPITIQFGGFAHVDDLSGRLERLANELCLDLHYNYRHNPGFDDTYRATYQIFDSVRQLRVRENQVDRVDVARQVNELDGRFHQVQSEVRRWSRIHSRQVGNAGALTKLDQIETALHDLVTDVGARGTHGDPQPAAAAANSEVAPPPPLPVPVQPRES